MATTTPKDARLDLRLTAEQKRLIEKAAELSGSTLAGFAINRLVDDASQVVARSRSMQLDEDDWSTFLDALDAPDGPKWQSLRTRPRAWNVSDSE